MVLLPFFCFAFDEEKPFILKDITSTASSYIEKYKKYLPPQNFPVELKAIAVVLEPVTVISKTKPSKKITGPGYSPDADVLVAFNLNNMVVDCRVTQETKIWNADVFTPGAYVLLEKIIFVYLFPSQPKYEYVRILGNKVPICFVVGIRNYQENVLSSKEISRLLDKLTDSSIKR